MKHPLLPQDELCRLAEYMSALPRRLSTLPRKLSTLRRRMRDRS